MTTQISPQRRDYYDDAQINRSYRLNLQKANITLIPELSHGSRPQPHRWRDREDEMLDFVYYDNRMEAANIYQNVAHLFHSGEFEYLFRQPKEAFYSATLQPCAISTSCAVSSPSFFDTSDKTKYRVKVVAISSHTLNAEPTELLNTEVMACLNIGRFVQIREQRKDVEIQLVLISVVTSYLRILRVDWNKECRRNVVYKAIRPLEIRIQSFSRSEKDREFLLKEVREELGAHMSLHSSEEEDEEGSCSSMERLFLNLDVLSKPTSLPHLYQSKFRHSVFSADGAISSTTDKVGGPFAKDGAIGKNFNADGAVGGGEGAGDAGEEGEVMRSEMFGCEV